MGRGFACNNFFVPFFLAVLLRIFEAGRERGPGGIMTDRSDSWMILFSFPCFCSILYHYRSPEMSGDEQNSKLPCNPYAVFHGFGRKWSGRFSHKLPVRMEKVGKQGGSASLMQDETYIRTTKGGKFPGINRGKTGRLTGRFLPAGRVLLQFATLHIATTFGRATAGGMIAGCRG